MSTDNNLRSKTKLSHSNNGKTPPILKITTFLLSLITFHMFFGVKFASLNKPVATANQKNEVILINKVPEDTTIATTNKTQVIQQYIPLPHVQMIGVQKASTTSVAGWLYSKCGYQRPKVFPGDDPIRKKEVHFFDKWKRYQEGAEFYSMRWDWPQNDQKKSRRNKAMDATPATLYFAKKVHDLYKSQDQEKDVKILLILREPISRELSMYNMYQKRFRKSKSPRYIYNKKEERIMTFDEWVQNRTIPCLTTISKVGMYASHLRKWYDLFDRNQILVLSHEEFINNPKSFQNRIADFLYDGVGPKIKISGKFDEKNTVSSKTKVKQPSVQSVLALKEVFDPLNEELYELMESSDLNRRPIMEQYPFPRFNISHLLPSEYDTDETANNSTYKYLNRSSLQCDTLN